MTAILFFGPDGAGKTTLAWKLLNVLKSKKHKVKIAWIRGNHTIMYLFSKIFFSKFRVKDLVDGQNPYIYSIPENCSKLWYFLQWFSALPVILVRYYLPSVMGYTIIGERSFIDLLIWMLMTSNAKSLKIDSFFLKHLILLSRKFPIQFFVKASLNELHKRSNIRRSSLEGSLMLYNQIAAILDNVRTIDTTAIESKEAVKYLIKELNSMCLI